MTTDDEPNTWPHHPLTALPTPVGNRIHDTSPVTTDGNNPEPTVSC